MYPRCHSRIRLDCRYHMVTIFQKENHPDYIGVNPNETGTSFELVKVFDKNIQIGIKLDVQGDYLYVATLHSITTAKLEHGLKNGRLKKI